MIDASEEPKKRPRTWLTDEEVDAMRTARAEGVSVTTLASWFGVHRGTVGEDARSVSGTNYHPSIAGGVVASPSELARRIA